jgi:signal peptidase
MTLAALRAVRRSLDAVRLSAMAIGLIVIGGSHLAPHVGVEPVIIRGRSMEPAIPFGSLVLVAQRSADSIVPGDVVTRRTAAGSLITHRVVRVAAIDGVPHVETRGDASSSPDPVLAPPSELVGVAIAHVPVAGYLVVFLAQPLGVLSAVCLLMMLLVAATLLEELEREQAAPGRSVDATA